MVGILDYGLGNIRSVVNSLHHLGAETIIVRSVTDLIHVDRVILPGVGAFSKAMENIEQHQLMPIIKQVTDSNLPLLGICLGMQILSSEGLEGKKSMGLGLIPGTVKKIEGPADLKLPHVGWNALSHARVHPIFNGINSKSDFYFVHSYEFVPENETDIVATTQYGKTIVAAVAKNNVIGVQFHPEKSQTVGLKLLENFLNWDGKC